MGLFKRKKTKLENEKAKVLDKPKLVSETKINQKDVEEIVKTTDSMQIVANSQDNKTNLEETSKALLKSYDIATRKIISTYEDVVENKKVITDDFLVVQMLIKNYETNSDIDKIAAVVKSFYKEIELQLAHGKTIRLTDSIMIDPTDYVGKMIPTAKIVEKHHQAINSAT